MTDQLKRKGIHHTEEFLAKIETRIINQKHGLTFRKIQVFKTSVESERRSCEKSNDQFVSRIFPSHEKKDRMAEKQKTKDKRR